MVCGILHYTETDIDIMLLLNKDKLYAKLYFLQYSYVDIITALQSNRASYRDKMKRVELNCVYIHTWMEMVFVDDNFTALQA